MPVKLSFVKRAFESTVMDAEVFSNSEEQPVDDNVRSLMPGV